MVVEVAKYGSIVKASEKLYISQSATSQSITSLEEELGLKIFRRSRHGTQVTHQGKSGIAVSFVPDYCMIGDPDVENGYIVPVRIRNYEATRVSLG
jgi:hypothetical protein